jgi:beta-N-acetylhexosaminidase
MAGMCIPMSRKKAVPYTIAAGCDMFLFTKNLDEDYEFMKAGVEDGTITQERLDEAVLRILGLKAALKLPEKQADGTLVPDIDTARKIIGCSEHKELERACADGAVTLVKNKQGLLPLNVNDYKRVLLYPIISGENALGYAGGEDVTEAIKAALEKEGFQVDVFEAPQGLEGRASKYQEMIDKYDLLLYVGNMITKSNQTVVRIEWAQPMGANCPNYQAEIPTIFISFANPYHLIDVPRIRTYINAYKFKKVNVEAVMDKLLGRSEFKGKDPVDSFCGMWDTRL